MSSYELDPEAILDFAFDWTKWLQSGETIVSHTVATTPGVVIDHHTEAAGVVTVWVKNGQLGTAPVVTCHVVTTSAREDDRSITLVVQER